MSNKIRVASWRRRQKLKVIKYLGGSCTLCNYSKTGRALEAHHVRPEDKSFAISDGSTRSWQKVIKELDKCLLVCANCHAEIHDGFFSMSTLSEILHNDLPLRKRRAETIIEEAKQVHIKVSEERKKPTKKRLRRVKPHCPCGVEISYGATRCKKCFAKTRQVVAWPSVEKLVSLVNQKGYTYVARSLGVSDNAVRKHLKNYQ